MNYYTLSKSFSYTNAFYQEMYKASISYDGMTDEEIFFSDYKEYETGKTKYGIGCVNAYDENSARDMIERMAKVLSAKDTSMDMLLAQISIFHDDISITYLVPSNKAASEVLETAFGKNAAYDGHSYRFEPGMSRKRVLVPAITDALKSYPKE